MARDRRHFTLSGIGKARPFAVKTGGSSRHPSDVNHREAHAQALLTALDHLPNIAENNLPGVYLAIEGRPHEVMVTKSLNASGLTLLKVEKQPGAPVEATVFAPKRGSKSFARGVVTLFHRGRMKRFQFTQAASPVAAFHCAIARIR